MMIMMIKTVMVISTKIKMIMVTIMERKGWRWWCWGRKLGVEGEGGKRKQMQAKKKVLY